MKMNKFQKFQLIFYLDFQKKNKYYFNLIQPSCIMTKLKG
jgi:hypothetical protein